MGTFQGAINYPFSKKIDLSGVTICAVMEVLRAEFGSDPYSGDHVKPETEALHFYMSNHVVALIGSQKAQGTSLTDNEEALVAEYRRSTTKAASRAFAYLLLICTREMRHLQSASLADCQIAPDEQDLFKWIKAKLRAKASQSAAHRIWSGEMAFYLGEYTTVLEKMFRYGKWPSGSFGGPAWADVTKCLRDYVKGVLTAEMMLDTVWTLCHNNGPIFNKGVLYHNYSSDLYRILDVQRAGQIPQYVWLNHTSEWYSEFLKQASVIFPSLLEAPDMALIKHTSLHPDLWEHVDATKEGFSLVKPAGHGENLITIQKQEADRG